MIDSRPMVFNIKRKRLQKNDFIKLLDNHSAQVLNTALRILGDSHQAQDVHQEVFLSIWRRWHKYNGRTNWDAYLYRATVRKAIELARCSRKQSILNKAEYITPKQRPDSSLISIELHQKLASSLAKLPKRQAEVFVLSRIEGLKTDRITEILGCSQQTVRVHLHRALKRLALEFTDYLKK